MAKQVEARVSTKAENHTKGGGLFDDIDATLRNPRYEPFQYPGTSVEVVAFAVDIVRDDDGSGQSEEERTFTQNYSGSKGLMPSKDGEFLIAEDPDSPPEGINENCNMAIFFDSVDQLVKTCAETRDSKGLTAAFDGMRVHLKNRVPPGTIDNKPRRPVLCVSKVYGNGATAAAATKKVGKPARHVDEDAEVEETDAAETEAGSGGDDMQDAVAAAVVKMLKKAKKPMSRKELMTGLSAFFEGTEKREATEVLLTPGFLKGGHDGDWEWDGSQAALG